MVKENTTEKTLWVRFKAITSGRWSLRVLYVLIGISLFADILSNDKPLVCSLNGTTYFPVLKSCMVNVGLSGWAPDLLNADWKNLEYDYAVFPLIPYAPASQDIYNRGCVGPFESQRVKSLQWHHWLGTDRLGRDVSAGMIHGTRVALLVGLISMSIATIIGIFFGALAGYFGNNQFKVSRLTLIIAVLLLGLFCWFMIFSRESAWLVAAESGWLGMEILFRVLVLTGIVAALLFLEKRTRKSDNLITIPVDNLIMRVIEIFRSLPGLLLLLALLSLFESSSIFYVMIIIGFLRWPSIAQFLRAELLKIRELEYIQSVKVLGFPDWKIILKHAIPNAITPVFITIAFGIAASILLEAFISFLGIGLAPEEVTWGSLLNDARQNISAWWLAVFPGFAIFITVTIFNLIGDALHKAISS